MGTSFSLKSLSELHLTSLPGDDEEDDWSCVGALHNTEGLVLLKLLRSSEDIEASFTHMTMEEVWVAFLEVAI